MQLDQFDIKTHKVNPDCDIAKIHFDDFKIKLDELELSHDAILANEKIVNLLQIIFQSSPYLSAIILKYPNFAFDLLQAEPQNFHDQLIADLNQHVESSTLQSDAMMHLRVAKQKIALALAVWDIAGFYNQAEITDRLSRFADLTIELALSFLLRDSKKFGEHFSNITKDCGLFIIAMGKHGAYELNYSSDVDLIVFFEPEMIQDKIGKDPYKYSVRLIKKLVAMLNERNEHGYVFRVDLRLRPDPGATQIAIPCDAALAYYESIGQNWERAAMIKSRICAGDMKLGNDFLKCLKPFTWRKYLDFATIRDVHAMKRQIHVHKGHGEIKADGHNIKLGRGGIREIEFFVQTQQLIAGGRQEELRHRNTLTMLDRLAEAEWIKPNVAKDMQDAYNFLRHVEHRIQMVNDEQTQTLPTDLSKLNDFALFAGFEDLDQFREALLAHLNTVQEHYGNLFEHAPELNTKIGNLVFTGSDHDEETLETLRLLGYEDAMRASDIVRQWHFARYSCLKTARTRGLLTEMMPTILTELAKAANADNALLAFDRFLKGLPAGVQLFSLFYNHEHLFNLFVNILTTAPRLANQLSHKSQLFDAVINPKFLSELPSKAQYERYLEKQMSDDMIYEEKLDVARIFGQEARFQIGVHLISQTSTYEDVGRAYTDLADVLIATMKEAAKGEIIRRYGNYEGEMVVLGLGKLGSGEMTFSSDLDMIVIYDEKDPEAYSDGRKQINGSVWFAKLTQSLISALTVPTAEGALFEVDMRLRPSGNKGPVASSLSSFISYQENDAWVWEHQALTRARVIAGGEQLSKDVEAAICKTICKKRDNDDLKQQVLDMRGRIHKEKGSDDIWHLKTVKGGLIDIEFIIQYYHLAHAHEIQDLREPNCQKSLEIFKEKGLIEAHICEDLSIALSLFSNLSQILRLTIEGDLDVNNIPDGLLGLLLSTTNSPDMKYLEESLKAEQQKIAQHFENLIGEY